MSRPGTDFNQRTVKRWIERHAHEERFFDMETGERNCTKLAEEAAAFFGEHGPNGPLDDPHHWVWDLAVSTKALYV